MKVTYRGPCFTVDEECEDLKQAFQFLGGCTELLGAATVCENCQGTDIAPKYKHIVTKDKREFDFYSLECQHCKWEFKFAETKSGEKRLFPTGWAPPHGSDGQSSGNGTPSKEENAAAKRRLEEEAGF